MYTLSSLSPLLLSLSEVLVSHSSPWLPAKRSSLILCYLSTCILQQLLKIVVGAMLVMVVVAVVVGGGSSVN